MTRDDHYCSDSPVFYNINYELPRHSSENGVLVLSCDVLDTNIRSVCHSRMSVIDTPNILSIAICHLPRLPTICNLHHLSELLTTPSDPQ